MKERLAPIALIAGTVACGVLLLATLGWSTWPQPDPLPDWWIGVKTGLWVYVGFVLSLVSVSGGVRRKSGGGFPRAAWRALWWVRLWHGWVVLMVLAGAVLGALLFPLGGLVFGVDLSIGRFVLAGLRDGAFYAFIWAPGISLILCFMLGYERARRVSGRDPTASTT
jgi:hypothetical protein